MANRHKRQKTSADIVAESEANEDQKRRFKEVVANLVFKGQDPNTIAKALHPDNKAAYQKTRKALWQMAENDIEFAELMGKRAHGLMVLALPKVTEALIRRAERGRPDAIKLLFEASGFHNPKVKHEHSGDISISLSIPRPEEPKKVPQLDDGEVVDAEVVEA